MINSADEDRLYEEALNKVMKDYSGGELFLLKPNIFCPHSWCLTPLTQDEDILFCKHCGFRIEISWMKETLNKLKDR